MVRLVDDLLKKVTGAYHLVGPQWDAPGFGLLGRAAEAAVFRGSHIRETQLPIRILFYRLHESVGNAD